MVPVWYPSSVLPRPALAQNWHTVSACEKKISQTKEDLTKNSNRGSVMQQISLPRPLSPGPRLAASCRRDYANKVSSEKFGAGDHELQKDRREKTNGISCIHSDPLFLPRNRKEN